MIGDRATRIDRGTYSGETPWDDAGTRAELLDWIDARLAEHDLEAAGELGVRLRPWSIVIRIPTASEPVWCKANPPGSAFEPALIRALDEWTPGFGLAPLAVDAEHGWSLLPDGGPLNVRPDSDDPPGTFRNAAVRRYGRLQRALVDRVPDLLALGVPDARPAALPDLLDRLLDRAPTPEVTAERSRVVDWAAELAERDPTSSLDHGDLHDHQIFAAHDGRHRFFDWGDASVGHPFATSRILLEITADNYGADSPAIGRLLDAFLDGWPGDPIDLRSTARLAVRLAAICRAASWERTFPGPRAEDPEPFIRSALLRLLVEPPF